MAEDICFFNKETLIIKPPKKSPLLLRTTVLVFAMVFGVYICSICLKQISIQTMTRFQSIKVIARPCHDIKLLEIPYKHYPMPETFSRAECARNPVRFFAILSMQRSGSGWFESLLNSHKNVSSNGEIFSVRSRRENISSIVQTLDKVYNLDWFSSASKNECSAATAFKWMLNQILKVAITKLTGHSRFSPREDGGRANLWLLQGLMEHHKEVVQYFNRMGVLAIFIFRRNLLRRMVSVLANSYDRYTKLLNGTHKSHVHSEEEADTLKKYKPTINCTKLITDLKEMELTTSKALEYFNSTRHFVLFYQDINRTKLKEVQEFLSLPQMELTSRQVKIHNGPLSDLIKNWDDVKKTLTGTPYEDFLHSDY